MFFFAHRGAALHHQVLALGASATGVSALDRSVDGGPAGQTALHALARGLGLSYERAHAICAALVAAGADVRARNAEGLTPLALAALLGRPSLSLLGRPSPSLAVAAPASPRGRPGSTGPTSTSTR